MSFLHLTSTRTRTQDRSPSPSLSRPLARRDTKRSRIITLSDDEDDADDYPYSLSHRPVRPSRALTLRNTPSQLERYNIWSDRHKSEDHDDTTYERERELERTREYRHSHSHRHRHHHHHHHRDDSDVDDEERAFRLRVRATFSRPHHHHHHHEVHDHHHFPHTLSFRRKDKWVDEGWETRERSRSRSRSRESRLRRGSFWGDGGFWGTERVETEKDSDDEKDVWSRYRRIKRTKTEEWRPLTGWRRV